jgi:hypothetical protein
MILIKVNSKMALISQIVFQRQTLKFFFHKHTKILPTTPKSYLLNPITDNYFKNINLPSNLQALVNTIKSTFNYSRYPFLENFLVC